MKNFWNWEMNIFQSHINHDGVTGKERDDMRRRGILFKAILLSVLIVVVLTGCQRNPEEGPREIAQTYFDAVKKGDVDKALSCYVPEVQQAIETGKDLSGLLSGKLFGGDVTDLGQSFMGAAAAEKYKNYEFKATGVKFMDDKGTKATVTVEVYIDDKLDREIKVSTVKYQDEWYIDADVLSESNTSEESSDTQERKAEFWESFEGEDTENLYLADARSFSEGAAWLTVSNGESFQSMVINEKEKSLYQRKVSTGTPSCMTNFSNEVSFISDENGSAVVNTKGKVVFTDEDIYKKCEEIFGEGSLDSFELLRSDSEEELFNGYSKVTMEVNTYEGSGCYQGILKPDGTWLLEPEEVQITMYPEWPLAVIVDREDNERALKLDTGEIYDAGPETHSNNLTGAYSSFFHTEFTQESFAATDGWGNDQSRQIPLRRWMLESLQENTDGLVYDSEMNAFVDKERKKVIDLSEYTHVEDNVPVFTNGYALLLVQNPDGDTYYTVVDKEGKRVFEPKKWGSYGRGYAYITGDRFLITSPIAPQFYAFAPNLGMAYMDLLTGEPIDGMSYEKMYPYVGEIALVMNELGYYDYIDLDGNVIF